MSLASTEFLTGPVDISPETPCGKAMQDFVNLMGALDAPKTHIRAGLLGMAGVCNACWPDFELVRRQAPYLDPIGQQALHELREDPNLSESEPQDGANCPTQGTR